MSLHRSAPAAALLAAILLAAPAAFLSAGEWVSGPMLGYRAHREVAIWFETRDAHEVILRYHVAGHPETAREIIRRDPPATPAGGQPMTFVLPALEMGTAYTYSIVVDGEEQSFAYPLAFTTTDLWEWRRDPPDFTFLFGSCAYINEPRYDRPGEPYGKTVATFQSMARSGADFMIWGGDNTYLREADFSSPSGIWHRYAHDRALPALQPLLAAMHHYAIWDDHDYGSNNANRSFEFKHVTLQAFQTYWPNPSAGEPDNPGIYTKFVWGDAFFILLDNRYHRDDSRLDQHTHPEKTQWGARQFDWLKQSLLHARTLRLYPFKFIVTGSQFLSNGEPNGEGHEHFRREREELLAFIREHDISGVIFLTGDVHHTGLYRHRLDDSRWVYELTSSPLSSGAWTDVANSPKARDPQLVPGTLVGTQNYCRIRIAGPRDSRRVEITCIDKERTQRWQHTIPLSALR